MNPEFWIERWNQRQIGFHQGQVNPQLTRYWAEHVRVDAAATVFVPLCGKSLDMLWLRQQGYTIVGIELSEIAIIGFFHENGIAFTSEARDGFMVFEGGGFQLWCGDYFALQSHHIGPVAAVYDRAALIAMPPELQAPYVRQLARILPASTPIFLIALEYDPLDMNGPPFPLSRERLASLFHDAELHLLAEDESLAENPDLRQRGLTWLKERVCLIRFA